MMLIIYIAYTILTVLIAVLAYQSHANSLLKGCAIIVLVTVGLGLETHYRSSLGAPIESDPPNGFIYVHHEVQGEEIAIWAWVEEKGNRLYVIPFDQDKAEKLAEAQEEGTPQQGFFINNQEDGQQNDSDTSLEFDDWVGDYTGETKGG